MTDMDYFNLPDESGSDSPGAGKLKLNKVMSEKEAVSRYLKDGDSFSVGGFLLNRESDCVFREIARQGQKNLKYIEESSTFSIDILIGTGAIDRFDQAYIAHRQVGKMKGLPCLDRCHRLGDPRPVQMGGFLQTPDYQGDQEPLQLVDWTNFMVSLRFVAGAMNVPFMPCRSGLGTDIPKYNKEIKLIDDPFENKPVALIPAYKPDVAFISVHKADRKGNGQVFGYKGTDEWKVRAAKHVVLFTEELVTTDEIRENPSNTIVPSYCTDAVVHQPFSSHPYAMFGTYSADSFAGLERVMSHQTKDGFKAWMDKWVYGCEDHFEYCDKIGWEKLEELGRGEKKSNIIP
jgi:glutaconate CoA-transferase, subunit A